MRTAFHEQLAQLTADSASMCGAVAEMNTAAALLLFSADHGSSTSLRMSLREVSKSGRAIGDHAFALLALQAPVAGELRAVVATLHIVRDIDRMAGLAANVARVAVREQPRAVMPVEALAVMHEMSSAAGYSALRAQCAIAESDPRMAAQMEQEDNRMNILHRQLFEIVMQPNWSHSSSVAADLVLVGRFYERFADHAVSIARHIHYQVTGDHMSAMESARQISGRAIT